jgi:hypothetical protein
MFSLGLKRNAGFFYGAPCMYATALDMPPTDGFSGSQIPVRQHRSLPYVEAHRCRGEIISTILSARGIDVVGDLRSKQEAAAAVNRCRVAAHLTRSFLGASARLKQRLGAGEFLPREIGKK